MALVVRWTVREIVSRRTEYFIETPARPHEIGLMIAEAERAAAGNRVDPDFGEVLIESTPEGIVVAVQRTETLSGSFRSTDR